MKIKLTAVQQPVFRDALENLECTLDILEDNKDTDWLLTPECAISGYCQPPVLYSPHSLITKHVEMSIEKIAQRAKELNIGIGLGSSIRGPDGFPYNGILFYKDGEEISVYKKRILTHGWEGGGELHSYLAGHVPNYFYMDELETVKASALICNDIWCMPRSAPKGNPYLPIELVKNDVDVIFVASNCNGNERDDLAKVWNENHLQIFAREFGFFIVHSNSATTTSHQETDHIQCSSGIIGPDGQWIAKCKDSGMDYVTVEVDVLDRRPTPSAKQSAFQREGYTWK
jgi:predicted amidohydrolase